MDYLLKAEPSEYTFADLLRDKETIWDGAAYAAAAKELREMTPGDRLVIYETGERKSSDGTASVVSVDASNPRNPRVKIKIGDTVNPIPRAEIKSCKLFADSPLVRMGRLGVVPLKPEQNIFLTGR